MIVCNVISFYFYHVAVQGSNMFSVYLFIFGYLATLSVAHVL
jgi:hypothetical protein